MKRMILTAAIAATLGAGAGWAARGARLAQQREDVDAVVGSVIGAYDDALSSKFPKPAPAPDELNVALTVCDSRKTLTPSAPQVASRDNCAARTLGWAKYWTEAVHANKAGRKIAPPFAGE